MTDYHPSSISEIRVHRQREEQQALRDYVDALRKWERSRERADDAAWELQLASAELQQKVLAGSSKTSCAELRQLNRQLEEKHRRLQHESRKAKERASNLFVALVAARNARLQFERCVKDDAITGEKAAPFSTRKLIDFPLPQIQWN